MDCELNNLRKKSSYACKRLNDVFLERERASFANLLKLTARRVRHYDEIGPLYDAINARMNILRSEESMRTYSEFSFEDYFRSITKTCVKNQVWVANYCVDFLTTSLGVRRENNLRGFTHKAIAIEIDGPSHENPIKQKKDAYRDDFLLSIGILPFRIANENVNQANVKNFISKLSPISTNDRNRIKIKIALATCAYHATDAEWSNLLIFSKEGKSHDKQ